MVDTELGNCDICGAIGVTVNRKYYYYDINCECCSNKHSEIVRYCNSCQPTPPYRVSVIIKPAEEK